MNNFLISHGFRTFDQGYPLGGNMPATTQLWESFGKRWTAQMRRHPWVGNIKDIIAATAAADLNRGGYGKPDAGEKDGHQYPNLGAKPLDRGDQKACGVLTHRHLPQIRF